MNYPKSSPDLDEGVSLRVPDWVCARARGFSVRMGANADELAWVLAKKIRTHGFAVEHPLSALLSPRWVQFVALSAAAERLDVDWVLDRMQEDAGARDAAKAACALGGFDAVRQFVVAVRAAQGGGHEAGA